MARRYRVEMLPGQRETVMLPPDLYGRAGLAPEVTVTLGSACTEAVRDSIPCDQPGVIAVSTDLLERLRLPPGLECRVAVGLRTLRLGPAVAVLAGRTPVELTPARLDAVANHFLCERDRGGLLYACDWESLDPELGEARGFRLLPGPGEGWEEGIFPLPDVLLRRFGLRLGRHFPGLRERGVLILNERVFHKWEAWQWLAADPQVRAHVPETAELRSTGGVLSMLQRFDTLFLKPAWGSLGSRIVRIRRLVDTECEIAESGREPVVTTAPEGLTSALAGRLPLPGIVQQGLHLSAVRGRLIDFRAVVQKDRSGRWSTTGIVGRAGTAGLFLSNMATGGFPLPAESAFALLFGPDPAAIFRRHREVSVLAEAVGHALDRSGLLLGDLGVDIAYDAACHPWVIEVNNRDPDHNIAWEAGLWPLFYEFRTRPVEYACRLAGFDGPGEGMMI